MHGSDTLRTLDADGHEIESKLNYDLKRVPRFVPLAAQAQQGTKATLENTYWKLIRLGETPIHMAPPRQEPHFVLNSETHGVGGSAGCNRLMGSYDASGDQLTFSQMATTMMACVEGMDTEKAFLSALAQVKSWKVAGQQLELLDSSGHAVATLEARYMK